MLWGLSSIGEQFIYEGCVRAKQSGVDVMTEVALQFNDDGHQLELELTLNSRSLKIFNAFKLELRQYYQKFYTRALILLQK